MKHWDKVTLKWDCLGGLNTSVRVDGEFDSKLNNPRVIDYKASDQLHGLFQMEAVSLYAENEHSRRGEMKLNIKRQDRNLPPSKDAIVARLNATFQKNTGPDRKVFRYKPLVKGPETVSWTDTIFVISYGLANGEQFCDFTIELGRVVFDALGVKDESGHHLANFTLERESFVMIDGSWITFSRWLRMSHRLPIWGPEDRAIA